MMTCDGSEDHTLQTTTSSNPIRKSQPLQKIQSNRMMLDLRQQVQWQSQVILDLKAERDRLTRELASRLFFVEAQLRREQKHIETLLSEKDDFIRFQALQIQSLKCILSQMDHRRQHRCTHRERPTSSACGRRSKIPPLSKRYSVALDEYMKDNGVVSRAQPVIIQGDVDTDTKSHSYRHSHARCTRTRSLPELRFDTLPEYENLDWFARQTHRFEKFHYCTFDHTVSPDVMDELAARRWTSDCDSEHSDSLDSGISSPSIKSRHTHCDDEPFPFVADTHSIKSNNNPPRRSSSIGNFINRTFSSSSTQQEKIKDNSRITENTVENGRRHNSFSGVEPKDIAQRHGPLEKIKEDQKSPNRFISSANRNFGTNHRSVTKPRDIKFRKLFKFRRRSETVNRETLNGEDYMTV